MQRLAIVARSKRGAEQAAAELVAAGPSSDRAGLGFLGRAAYLSATEVIFVFEGQEIEWRVDDLVANSFRWPVQAGFEKWRRLVEGQRG
jgi:hypothetical protein